MIEQFYRDRYLLKDLIISAGLGEEHLGKQSKKSSANSRLLDKAIAEDRSHKHKSLSI